MERETEYQAIRGIIKPIRQPNDGEAEAVAFALTESLTDYQRKLVLMYYVEQRTMSDIASELGIGVSTVSRTLQRARARLGSYMRFILLLRKYQTE